MINKLLLLNSCQDMAYPQFAICAKKGMSACEVDIIILSNTASPELARVTQNCLDSLFASEPASNIVFNVVVVETNRASDAYHNVGMLYPAGPFGFNRFLNFGILATKSEFLCMCNNDLAFHKGWASEIIGEMSKDRQLMSASPYCPDFHDERGIALSSAPIAGYETALWFVVGAYL